MKTTILYKAATLCFLFVSLTVKISGQSKTDYDRYMGSVQEKSILYRGKEAPQYNYKYNGNPYWDGDKFRTGNVVFNEKLYSGLPLRIDAVTGELSVNLEGTQRAVILETKAVRHFTMDGIKYVNLKISGIEDADEGYYECIHEGDFSVYRRVTKSAAFSYEPQNEKGIGYFDPEYKDGIYDYFEQRINYFLVRDGHLTRISKRKAEKYAAQK